MKFFSSCYLRQCNRQRSGFEVGNDSIDLLLREVAGQYNGAGDAGATCGDNSSNERKHAGNSGVSAKTLLPI